MTVVAMMRPVPVMRVLLHHVMAMMDAMPVMLGGHVLLDVVAMMRLVRLVTMVRLGVMAVAVMMALCQRRLRRGHGHQPQCGQAERGKAQAAAYHRHFKISKKGVVGTRPAVHGTSCQAPAHPTIRT